jgi:DNA-binding transcriptional MerR regulator
MPLSRSRDYLSIGEVLESIKVDFPDISISKIRFLEAEGLIEPERTSSGYRKFYETDVATLRHILSLQRDHFMPLKVIKERLANGELNGGPIPAPAHAPSAAAPRPVAGTPPADLAGVSMDRAELRAAANLTESELAGLEEFGILDSKEAPYDENDLVVAKAARKFFDYGVEPRHLRMYKQMAERETSFFEQIVSPVARRRDPDAQNQVTRSVHELAGLSRQMREAALRSSLKELL